MQECYALVFSCTRPGGSLYCQVIHHVRQKKIYFLHKASPKWVKLYECFFISIHGIYYIVKNGNQV